MSASPPKADFKLVLQSVNPTRVQEVVAELTELFPIDQKTALGAVQKAPIILIGGMTQQMAANLRTHLIRLGRLGAQLKLTAEPVGKLNVFRWPSPPPPVLRPANLFTCPACGERFVVRPWQPVAGAPAPAAAAAAPAPTAAVAEPAAAPPPSAAEAPAEVAPPPAEAAPAPAELPPAVIPEAQPVQLSPTEEEAIPEAEPVEGELLATAATPQAPPKDELAEITGFLDSILKDKARPSVPPPRVSSPEPAVAAPPAAPPPAAAAAPAPLAARVEAPMPKPSAPQPTSATRPAEEPKTQARLPQGMPAAPRPVEARPQPVAPTVPRPVPEALPVATLVAQEPATEPMAPRPMQPQAAARAVASQGAPAASRGPQPAPTRPMPRPMNVKAPSQVAPRPLAPRAPGAAPRPLVPPKAAAPAPRPAPAPEPTGPRYDVSVARVRDSQQEDLVRLLVERSGMAPEEAQRQSERTVVMVCKGGTAAEAEEWRRTLDKLGFKPRIRKH